MIVRKMKTNTVRVGALEIGGGAPVVIQSMTNTDTRDIPQTVSQIRLLSEAGCGLVRMSIYDSACAQAIAAIKREVQVPLAADIHFDYRLALQSVENGIDKLRINPGNIGGQAKVAQVADAAKERGIPIRIGVNAGSLEKDLLAKYRGATAEALVASALGHARLLEKAGFFDIVLSVKHSDVAVMVEAYRKLAAKTQYPLHLGVTESGTAAMGTVKSAIGIGALLLDGIGDTIRVSLSGDPVQEIAVAKRILRACGNLKEGVEVIACPTCGRTSIEVEAIALEVEKRLSHIKTPLKVAVMGCVVNGPGEASAADVGIAGAAGQAVLFCKGQKIGRIQGDDVISALVEKAEEIAEEKERLGR